MANTELPEHVLNYILERYLRAYLFNNHNKAPEKIIVPRITSISIYVGKDEQLTVPVEFEKEEPIDSNRPSRASGDSRSPTTKRSSKQDASKSE